MNYRHVESSFVISSGWDLQWRGSESTEKFCCFDKLELYGSFGSIMFQANSTCAFCTFSVTGFFAVVGLASEAD